jgi:ribosomal protein S21
MKKGSQVIVKPRHPKENNERLIRRFLKKVKKERIVEETRERRR